MTAHLFQIITQHCLHLLNIAMHSSIILRETLIYGNELIICVGTSNYCVLIAEPSSNFADGFFSFTYWQLLHLGFDAFSTLQVPRGIWFSFAQNPPPHLLSLCPIIQTAVNNRVTVYWVFTNFRSAVRNCFSKTGETNVIPRLSLGPAGVACLLISVIVVTDEKLGQKLEMLKWQNVCSCQKQAKSWQKNLPIHICTED